MVYSRVNLYLGLVLSVFGLSSCSVDGQVKWPDSFSGPRSFEVVASSVLLRSFAVDDAISLYAELEEDSVQEQYPNIVCTGDRDDFCKDAPDIPMVGKDFKACGYNRLQATNMSANVYYCVKGQHTFVYEAIARLSENRKNILNVRDPLTGYWVIKNLTAKKDHVSIFALVLDQVTNSADNISNHMHEGKLTSYMLPHIAVPHKLKKAVKVKTDLPGAQVLTHFRKNASGDTFMDPGNGYVLPDLPEAVIGQRTDFLHYNGKALNLDPRIAVDARLQLVYDFMYENNLASGIIKDSTAKTAVLSCVANCRGLTEKDVATLLRDLKYATASFTKFVGSQPRSKPLYVKQYVINDEEYNLAVTIPDRGFDNFETKDKTALKDPNCVAFIGLQFRAIRDKAAFVASLKDDGMVKVNVTPTKIVAFSIGDHKSLQLDSETDTLNVHGDSHLKETEELSFEDLPLYTPAPITIEQELQLKGHEAPQALKLSFLHHKLEVTSQVLVSSMIENDMKAVGIKLKASGLELELPEDKLIKDVELDVPRDFFSYHQTTEELVLGSFVHYGEKQGNSFPRDFSAKHNVTGKDDADEMVARFNKKSAWVNGSTDDDLTSPLIQDDIDKVSQFVFNTSDAQLAKLYGIEGTGNLASLTSKLVTKKNDARYRALYDHMSAVCKFGRVLGQHMYSFGETDRQNSLNRIDQALNKKTIPAGLTSDAPSVDVSIKKLARELLDSGTPSGWKTMEQVTKHFIEAVHIQKFMSVIKNNFPDVEGIRRPPFLETASHAKINTWLIRSQVGKNEITAWLKTIVDVAKRSEKMAETQFLKELPQWLKRYNFGVSFKMRDVYASIRGLGSIPSSDIDVQQPGSLKAYLNMETSFTISEHNIGLLERFLVRSKDNPSHERIQDGALEELKKVSVKEKLVARYIWLLKAFQNEQLLVLYNRSDLAVYLDNMKKVLNSQIEPPFPVPRNNKEKIFRLLQTIMLKVTWTFKVSRAGKEVNQNRALYDLVVASNKSEIIKHGKVICRVTVNIIYCFTISKEMDTELIIKVNDLYKTIPRKGRRLGAVIEKVTNAFRSHGDKIHADVLGLLNSQAKKIPGDNPVIETKTEIISGDDVDVPLTTACQKAGGMSVINVEVPNLENAEISDLTSSFPPAESRSTKLRGSGVVGSALSSMLMAICLIGATLFI